MARPLVWLTILLVVSIMIVRFFFPAPPRTFSKAPQTPPNNPLVSFSLLLRGKLLSIHQDSLPAPYNALMGGIVFGSQASPLPEDIQEDYKKVGVVHILVVSGAQVAILVGVCLALTRTLGFPLWGGVVFASIVNLLFVTMTGAGPSILRSGIMAEIAMLAKLLERDNDFYTSLAVAALVLLLINPDSLFDIGFQLSFLATWALVYIAPALEVQFKKFLPGGLAVAFGVAVAPTLATFPIILFYFSRCSLISVLANVIIVPAVEILVVSGFIVSVMGMIFAPLAQVIEGGNLVLLWFTNALVQGAASLSWASVNIVPPSLPLLLGYYALLVAVMEKLRRGEKIIMDKARWGLLGVGILAVFIWHMAVGPAGIALERPLTVTFLDVGQGDSILVEAPSGKRLLIDGGGKDEGGGEEGRRDEGRGMNGRKTKWDVGAKVVVPALAKKGINYLDVVVLTHPHEDHVGGLPAVLRNIKVGMVLDSGQFHTSLSFRKFLKLIDEKGINYKLARAGMKLDLGDGVGGIILNPAEPFTTGTESDLNNNSVVIRLTYGKVSFMFMGDTAKEGEGRIMDFAAQNNLPLQSTVLKVGHHGSATSSSEEFLRTVSPKITVISVGKKNKYHHPHKSLVERLEKLGVNIYRTDKHGDITMKSDGTEITVDTAK